jgi:hypothetical protein
MSELMKSTFIAGYKCSENQTDTLWLCTHPESLDLIFSKDENKAFIFKLEKQALAAITKILIADNRFLFIPVAKAVHLENPAAPEHNHSAVTLEQTEAKIKELLVLFNERSNSQLQLFLTLNQEDNTIRGYGSGLKLGEAVPHFVALLAIKGMKVQQVVEQNVFTVHIGQGVAQINGDVR